MCNKFDTHQNQQQSLKKYNENVCTIITSDESTANSSKTQPNQNSNQNQNPTQHHSSSFTSNPRPTSKKPLLLMTDPTKTPKRLVWNMTNKQWEYKSESQDADYKNILPMDNKYTPKRNGWCWEGIHCTNPYCKFKHRNLPPVDSNQHSSLPSSIRGPRQHKASSNLTNN